MNIDAEALRTFLRENDMSQRDFAALSGSHQSNVSAMVNGRRKIPADVRTIVVMWDLLDTKGRKHLWNIIDARLTATRIKPNHVKKVRT